MSRSSHDQSISARHSPSTSGCPARSWASTAAISARQRSIHGAALWDDSEQALRRNHAYALER
jgi:hypothetical protein